MRDLARRRTLGFALLTAILLGLGGGMPGATRATGPVVVSHGPRTAARVAITIDDGVSPANCRRLLAILLQHDVPATFFPISAAMHADPAFWRLVVAAGDPIGDHTVTHPQMPSLSQALQFDQIDEARRTAESISGAPVLRVFRPPYGAYNAATLAAAAQAGFPTVLLWDASDRDTSRQGTIAEMLQAAEAARNGSVILMHCGPDAAPYVLGPLLDDLVARGLQPVTVATLLGLTWTSTATGPKPTVAQVLNGLSPLPPQPSGGPVIGPSGIGTMTFPPLPSPSGSPSAPAASPVSTASASATPLPSPTNEPSATAGTSGPGLTAGPSPTLTGASGIAAAVTASPAPSPGAVAAVDPQQALAVGGVVLLLALGIVLLGLARARRRPRG